MTVLSAESRGTLLDAAEAMAAELNQYPVVRAIQLVGISRTYIIVLIVDDDLAEEYMYRLQDPMTTAYLDGINGSVSARAGKTTSSAAFDDERPETPLEAALGLVGVPILEQLLDRLYAKHHVNSKVFGRRHGIDIVLLRKGWAYEELALAAGCPVVPDHSNQLYAFDVATGFSLLACV